MLLAEADLGGLSAQGRAPYAPGYAQLGGSPVGNPGESPMGQRLPLIGSEPHEGEPHIFCWPVCAEVGGCGVTAGTRGQRGQGETIRCWMAFWAMTESHRALWDFSFVCVGLY